MKTSLSQWCGLIATSALFTAACGSPDATDGEKESGAIEQESNVSPQPTTTATVGPQPPIAFCLAPTTLVSNVKPTSIAVDATQIYFSQSTPITNIALGKLPIGGGAVTNIVTDINGTSSVTVANGWVYWIKWFGSKLYRAPTEGGATELIYDADSLNSIEDQALVVRVNPGLFGSTNVYWAHVDTSRFMRITRSVFAPGWTVTDLQPVADPSPPHLNYYPFTLTADATTAYFGRDNGSIYSVPLAGGTPTQIATGGVAKGPTATDGTYVYFAKGNDIAKVPVGGGATTTFELNAGTVGGMAIDATHLYWTSKSTGFVGKKPLAGGSTVTITCGQTSPLAITVDSSYVYFGTSTALKRRPK